MACLGIDRSAFSKDVPMVLEVAINAASLVALGV